MEEKRIFLLCQSMQIEGDFLQIYMDGWMYGCMYVWMYVWMYVDDGIHGGMNVKDQLVCDLHHVSPPPTHSRISWHGIKLRVCLCKTTNHVNMYT